ncbi:LysR family transcriptional regulator [Clostridium sp. MD294]|uniref:LysR family transcriptional regulator n=1 Tax=Clostridium sp. MD294 TaxID=97138 RepID=UPI0002CA456E|nr:LysR family transcriptional regulator [Clostridium sp. MD294]USF29355.1 HTH-type transcriptional regulator GltR [Clostridium sp. MD294]
MEIRNLMTFLKVVELQNFTRAAKQLDYSQSTVTIQIQQLEQELNVKLFERIGKKVSVTEKGWEVFQYAKEIRNLVEKMTYMSTEQNNIKGQLCIGVIESLICADMPKILSEYHRKYPEVELIVKTNYVDELIEMMVHNQVDFIFIIDRPLYHKEWIKPYMKKEEISFFTQYGNSLTKRKNVCIQEILKQPFILTEKGISYRKELDEYIQKNDIDFKPFLEIGDTKIIVELLKRGEGISFLPKIVVLEEMKNQTIQKINVENWNVVMWKQIIYHRNKYVTPQMNTFIKMMIEMQQNK